ncbi:MAG: 16S rRNA (cytidine(1402)-2'-O)-methyltransferase [Bacillota bacterium]|jgi:16S rRNA (cytidine1402-2'-O)-methyltransferase
MSDTLRGTLYVVSTPVGNMGDITHRAVEVLSSVDLVAAEDTRHTGLLLARLGISAKLVSCHEHNERGRARAIVQRLLAGEDVALVSDAGTPGISDPGEIVIAEAIEAGCQVVPVPGATAFVPALTVSGLPSSRFMFIGFLPRKAKERRAALEEVAHLRATLIFYEAPHRLAATLRDLFQVLGDRRCAVCWELTKKFERVWRGTLGQAAEAAGADDRGEIVIVVDGAPAQAGQADRAGVGGEEVLRDAAERAVELAAAEGLSLRDAAAKAAGELGLPMRKVYSVAVRAKRRS